jgi:pyruvate/2-oxoglutarate dehydrogenase complex dihydrolipoamide dehydrogenase (E3) component
LDTNLKEIISDEKGRAKAVVTDKGETIPCTLVGLTAGVTPHIDFLQDSGIELGRGVKVNRFLETNVANVYAIGDCAEQREPIGLRRPIEAVWYTGRMMGEALAQTLCGNPMEYHPGHWFNSAKFLDIEYQTYGWVFSERNKAAHELHFHWRHPQKKICITLAYHKDSGEFLGINTFGIRMRHAIFDRWLTEKRSVHYIMEHLRDAHFDPEFFTSYEKMIVAAFNSATNSKISLKKKSWKRLLQRS